MWHHVSLEATPLRELIAYLANRGVYLDPTLSIDEYDTLFLYDEEATHPANRYLDPSFVRRPVNSSTSVKTASPASSKAENER